MNLPLAALSVEPSKLSFDTAPPNLSEGEYLYRIDRSSFQTISIRPYKVQKRTQCGVWLELWSGKRKFVNLTARKKWACDTVDKALDSFIKRKQRQVQLLETQLTDAQEQLALAKKYQEKKSQ